MEENDERCRYLHISHVKSTRANRIRVKENKEVPVDSALETYSVTRQHNMTSPLGRSPRKKQERSEGKRIRNQREMP